jgi:hypothetical protein
MVGGMDTRRRGPAQESGRKPVASVLVGLAVILCLAVIGLVVGQAVTNDRADCSAVGSRVADLDAFTWDNGITSSGSSWVNVLTDGVTEADDPSRRRIARAVQSDEAGFQHFRGGLSDDAALVAERLRQIAVAPFSSVAADDAQRIERDSDVLRRHALEKCGFA